MTRSSIIFGAAISLLMLSLTAVSNAAELKVLDQLGLIRLIKQNVNEPQALCANVRVGGVALTLINRDGLESDITASLTNEKSWRFDGVKPGIWQVVAESNEEILALEICKL